jgi:ubiquinol-cytochrome c reductase cytochrome b subunit
LEPPADPTSSDYIPRPEWYFLGLFQLLKYFPGRLEIVGAMVVPGLAFAFLLLLPWLDRGRDRTWASRRGVLGFFTAGLAAAVTLTVLGALDRPPVPTTAWDVRELAGVALIGTSDRCTRCHGPDRVAAPIEPGTISRPADWLAAHVTDPIAIAPGVREAPASNEFEVAALVAALGRIRSEPAPSIDPVTARAVVAFNRECLACHTVDGIGGRQGPNLSAVGRTMDATTIERRIINPFDVQIDATMPPFDGVLARETIHAIAQWLAARK